MVDFKLKTTWHFRTIGLGTINYRAASKRLAGEALSTGLFQTSNGYSEKDLKHMSPQFWSDHKNVLKARIHGFGWYLWKPELIRTCLNQIPLGHGLMYCDAGNYISLEKSNLALLSNYLNLATKHNILASNDQDFIEEHYSSQELMDLLSLTNEQRKSNQFMAGFMLIVNSPEGRTFANSWSSIACANDHNYLLQKLSFSPIKEFVYNQHDQAIFSCLLKNQNKPSIKIGDKFNLGCVRALRHRYGFKYDNPSLISVSFYKSIAIISRIKLALERRIFKNSSSLRPTQHFKFEIY